MSLRPHTDQRAAEPRRDVLGFFKSVVEFFTGMTGLAVACVGLLGAVVTIALASGGSSAQTPPLPPQIAETRMTSPISTAGPSGSLISDIESGIQTNLGAWLAGTGEVIDDISCAQDSDTHANCTAAMSGTGPSAYSIDVEIDPSTGLYAWLVVGASI